MVRPKSLAPESFKEEKQTSDDIFRAAILRQSSGQGFYDATKRSYQCPRTRRI